MNQKIIESFYKKHLDMKKARAHEDELRAPCPYHKDKNPSFSVNMMTGLYSCFKPDCKLYPGGNMARFLSVIEDMPLEEAEDYIRNLDPHSGKDTPYEPEAKPARDFPYTQDHINQRMQDLLNAPEILKGLIDKTLWTMETIKHFEIGYDRTLGRFWIPIKQGIRILNIRQYGPGQATKVISVSGFGEATIFPYSNMEGQEIIMMEGEKDCILANQHGFNAVTATGGAGTFKTEWRTLFAGKDVVICYDIDTAGREGAEKVIKNLTGIAKTVKNVLLPLTTPPTGDYTDWISQGATPMDFRALIDKTEVIEPEPEGPIEIPDEVYESTLDQLADKKLFYKRVKMNVRIISKDSSPSIIPKGITVTCNHDMGRPCHNCGVGDAGNSVSKELTEATAELLQLIECTTKERTGIIKDVFRVPKACNKFKVKETDHQAITRCSVIPAIDDIKFDAHTYNQKYVERELFFMEKNLEANQDYEIHVIAMPDPKTQALVHLGYKVQPSDSSIEEFCMTPELKQQLEIFQCPSETK